MATARATLGLRLTKLRQSLAERPDSEHVQALIRIVFGLCVSVYLYATIGPRPDVHVICIGFEVFAIALLAAIVERPQRSVRRQHLGAVVDLGVTTYLMWRNGEIGVPLYGIYLWVTFGNGFRYGVRSLYVSHALSLLGFGCVVAFSRYWHQHALTAGGFLVLLAALPAYGAVLLKTIERANETLRDQALRDVLTGLYNRRHLAEAFERELRRARRGAYGVGVMIIDIDHFKRFNDTYGHAAGDEVLRSVAQLMLNLVRREDILCRYGGEEFVVVQTRVGAEALLQRAEAIRGAVLGHEIVHHGHALGTVTLSVGAAVFPEHGQTAAALLAAADAALYRAKHLGRNRAVMAAPWQEAEGATAAKAAGADTSRVLAAPAAAQGEASWR